MSVELSQSAKGGPVKSILACMSAFLFTIGLSAVPATAGPAAAATIVVYPTGQFPDDVANVQAAVDQEGTVLLKATNASGEPAAFNFGPPQPGSGGVDLGGTVAVVGERAGSTMTTIKGGHTPFVSLPGATVHITGVNFDTPLQNAIFLFDPASAEIVGNRIVHVAGRQGSRFTFATAISSFGGDRIVIRDNVIEEVDSQLGVGIGQARARSAVDIVGNYVSGTNTVGIESSQSASVRIADNVVLAGAERHPVGSDGTCIEVNGPGSFQVVSNTLVPRTTGVGISVFGTTNPSLPFAPVVAPVVIFNQVTTAGDAIGIKLQDQVSNAYVGQNRIEGSGFSALAAFGFFQDKNLPSNTFVGNNIAGFVSSFADVFLDESTHETVLVGPSGTVVDLGIGNRITGFTSLSDETHIGRQISEASALRQQAIHEARSEVESTGLGR